jgi:hypothetical protein
MKAITALFDSKLAAKAAVAELEGAGVRSDDLSIVGFYDRGDALEDATTGAALAAALGGAGGLLAGVAALALPSVRAGSLRRSREAPERPQED